MHYSVKTNFIESAQLMPEDSISEAESKKACKMSKKTIMFIAAFIITVTVAFCYTCDIWAPRKFPNVVNGDGDTVEHAENSAFDDIDLRRDFPLDLNRDVFVPLYIQKTGVLNLVDHIIQDSDIQPRCQFRSMGRGHRARFDCVTKDNSTWLAGRTTGAPNKCGLFPDWTALTQCTVEKLKNMESKSQKRRYHYITMLREPVKRFISEHLSFLTSEYWIIASVCDGKQPEKWENIRVCYKNISREQVTLDRFMECPVNYAVNRQTRMLADLRLVNCYNHSGMTEVEHDKIILESAKQNLRELSFFGLTEYQHLSKLVFEKTFNVKFLLDFRQFDATLADTTAISPSYLENIAKVNYNDVTFYNFAKSLFFQRVKHMGLN